MYICLLWVQNNSLPLYFYVGIVIKYEGILFSSTFSSKRNDYDDILLYIDIIIDVKSNKIYLWKKKQDIPTYQTVMWLKM